MLRADCVERGTYQCQPRYEHACICSTPYEGWLKYLIPPAYVLQTNWLLTDIMGGHPPWPQSERARMKQYTSYFPMNESLLLDTTLLRPEAWDILEPRLPLSIDSLLGFGRFPLLEFHMPLGVCILNRIFLFFIFFLVAIVIALPLWLWRKYRRQRYVRGRLNGTRRRHKHSS